VIASTHRSHDHRPEAAAPVRISPDPARTAAAEPASGAPTPLRGTLGTAFGVGVDQGLAPYELDVFEYGGRLAVLMKMKQVSPDLKQIVVYSVRSDGSLREPGDLTFGEQKPVPHEGVIPFFFKADVALDRCVQLQLDRRSGPSIADPRTVCPSKLSAADQALAEAAWKKYLQSQQPKAHPPKPASKPPRAV
jgi:hypothetical protein